MSEADHVPDPSVGTPRRSKRSATLSLVLVAGAGAAAPALARLDPTQREEEALVYGTAGACIGEGWRSPEDCEAAERTARERYAATAPRYDTRDACERQHGRAGCRPGEDVTPAARGRYLPVMTAFLMGRSDEQDLPVQPLYAHAPEDEAQAAVTGGGGHAGGYCTGAGGRVFTAGGGSRFRAGGGRP